MLRTFDLLNFCSCTIAVKLNFTSTKKSNTLIDGIHGSSSSTDLHWVPGTSFYAWQRQVELMKQVCSPTKKQGLLL